MPSLSTVGDLAQTLILSRHGRQLKLAMQQLGTEATTGLVADQSARLKGNFVTLAGIESSLSQLDSYRTVTTETQAILGVMQTALGTMTDQATTLGAALISGASSGASIQIDTLGTDAASRLDTIMSALNTHLGERALFSGQATDSPAVTSAGTLLDALQAAVTASGAVSASDVQTAVNDWFADPAGYRATVYQGGAALNPVPIAQGQTAQIDVTAMDPAIVQMVKGVAMAALLSRGVLAGSDVARADLAKRAGEDLAGTQTVMAELGARLGTTQASVANAATSNDAQRDTLDSARLNLLSVDPYETASKYQEVQGQLQTLYTLTARASKLKLVDFL